MMPLTKEQLESLGFHVEIKKTRSTERVFVFYPYENHPDGHDMIGGFYHFPTFPEIVDEIIKNTKENLMYDIRRKIADNLLD